MKTKNDVACIMWLWYDWQAAVVVNAQMRRMPVIIRGEEQLKVCGSVHCPEREAAEQENDALLSIWSVDRNQLRYHARAKSCFEPKENTSQTQITNCHPFIP